MISNTGFNELMKSSGDLRTYVQTALKLHCFHFPVVLKYNLCGPTKSWCPTTSLHYTASQPRRPRLESSSHHRENLKPHNEESYKGRVCRPPGKHKTKLHRVVINFTGRKSAEIIQTIRRSDGCHTNKETRSHHPCHAWRANSVFSNVLHNDGSFLVQDINISPILRSVCPSDCMILAYIFINGKNNAHCTLTHESISTK
jgi:hypothetical protein